MTAAIPEALAAQRRLLDKLRDPACYPHPVSRIELIETHISFVVLTGDYAYKIKKAVDLGFVDYRTPQRRLFCCREELRLNRRLAAPLYLDVVAIADAGATPRLDIVGAADTPAAAEYAVRMREFAQSQRLDHVLAQGNLAPRELDRLATRIAAFHREVPAAMPADPYGSPAAIAAPMLDNFRDLRRLAGSGPAPRLDALEAWSRQEYDGLAAEFAARKSAGRVRECHGDLHLGNMIRLDDGIHVFDGIEFNPALRWIDVVSEIAFLVMDLAERGRPDYAWRCLDAWLAESGDYGGLRVLPFYLAYRALVRAKVERIRAAQPDAAAGERDQATAAAQRYLDFAGSVPRKLPRALILMHGASGSGKSHVARQIVEAGNAIRLRSDVERKRINGLPALADSGSAPGGGIYDEANTAATYARLAGLATQVLDAGFTAIVDASFLDRRQRDDFRRLAAGHGVRCLIVHCDASPDQMAERIAARRRRAGDASEATTEILARQLRQGVALDADELPVTRDVGSDDRARASAIARLVEEIRATA